MPLLTRLARDGLHEAVGLERLVEVHGRERLHVEAGKPHGTYEDDAERVVGILELVVKLALLHLLTVRRYVEPPLAETIDLVLLLAHHNRHLGGFHPRDFAALLHGLLLIHADEPCTLLVERLCPVLPHVVVHHHAGNLVHADEHGFARLPDVRVVGDEVACHGSQARLGHDDMDTVVELGLHLLGLVGVEVGILNGLEKLVVNLRILDAELIAAILVEQRHRGPILDGALEVVDRNVTAEGPGS